MAKEVREDLNECLCGCHAVNVVLMKKMPCCHCQACLICGRRIKTGFIIPHGRDFCHYRPQLRLFDSSTTDETLDKNFGCGD